MTNAQKWVTAFLVLFIVLFALSKLTEKEEEIYEDVDYYSETGGSSTPDGSALITRSGCASCHGSNLQGTQVGPSLVNIKEHWTRDALINYLRNPVDYSGDKRFETYREKYPNIVMPSYSNIDIKDLGTIADYLLQLK